MTTFSVIGAGNLGANLIHALGAKGYALRYVFNRSKFRQFDPFVEKNLDKIITESEVIFICVRESQIGRVVSDISSAGSLRGKIFFHTSNSQTSDELIPLKKKGASTASFSPLQTFSGYRGEEGLFKGIYFLAEGDDTAVQAALNISRDLESNLLEIKKEFRMRFHIGAVMSSNFLNSLLRVTDKILGEAGGYDHRIMLPLVKRTLLNIESKGLQGSLTGPAVRNETELIEKHLGSLTGRERELYRLLSSVITESSDDFT